MLTGDILRRSAERFPAKPAVLFDGRVAIDNGTLDQQADRLASALHALGLAKGTRVAIVSRNLPPYATVFFGVARSGCVLVNVSVLYTPDELQWVLNKCGAQMLIFDAALASRIGQTVPLCPGIRHLVQVGRTGADASAPTWPDRTVLHDYDQLLAQAPPRAPAVSMSASDPFCMTYTGGTTGRPKGVLCSHRARLLTAHTVAIEEALDERDVVAIVTPMFHVAALNIMFQPAMLVGATCSFITPWSPEGFMTACERDGITAAFMVPTQANALVTHAGYAAAVANGRMTTWRKLSFAGAPMPDWVQRELLRTLPTLALTQIYGQSEMGVLTSLRHWHLPGRLGSVGRQAYNVEVGLFDPVTGTRIAPGSGGIGEIASRGENLMLEYFDEPEQTAAFFKFPDALPGWGFTGDVGTIDADGFITLLDRAKDMLISGGENVYPKEIEDAIYTLPEVAECAVFGIPDEKFGELPAAYVLCKPGMALTEAQVTAQCETLLARHKRPRVIRFVTEFPKTPIGKIQKNLLKAPWWAGRDKAI